MMMMMTMEVWASCEKKEKEEKEEEYYSLRFDEVALDLKIFEWVYFAPYSLS